MYHNIKLLTLLLLSFLIVPSIYGATECVSGSRYINIISQNEYAINENIANITVRINKDVFDILTSKITAILKDGVNEVGTRLSNGFVNQLGETKVDFKYTSSRSTNLKIEVYVEDSSGNKYQTSKNIYVKPTLDTRLSCDLSGFVGRVVKCTWKTYDMGDTSKVLNPTSSVSVNQGSTVLVYSPIQNGIEFTTQTSGSADVILNTQLDGYISDKDSTSIEIQPTSTSKVFKLDNKDFFSYSTTGIATGTHQLTINIEESSLPIDIQKVEATMKTPAGQETPLIFNKISVGVYQSTYNFIQAGQTYEFSGSVVFKDISKPNDNFNYKITTTQTPTEDFPIGLIISIGAVIILVFIITIVLWSRGRGSKPSAI